MRRPMTLLAAALLATTMLVAVVTPPGAATTEPVHTVGMVDTDQGLWVLWDPLLGYDSFYYGNPGDVPFVGDWDGDGTETPGLYRQSDGYVYLRNSNSQGIADVTFFFGDPGDLPLVGDFDGDGDDTVSVYRPSLSTVFVINELGSGDAGLGAADFSFVFSDPGDAPFVGDFDGDGVDTVGLHRQSTGRVYFRNSLSTGIADADFVYGNPGDVIIAGDWTGDGVDTVGIFRPADIAFYLNYANARGVADETILMDWTGSMLPVAGALGRTGMVSFADRGCGASSEYTETPFDALQPSPAPAPASDAVGVLGMSFTRGRGCDRAVIGLGADPGDPFASMGPASSVPAGVVVGADGNRIHVEMPGITRGRIRGMDFLGDPYAFVVREWGVGNDDLYVDIHYGTFKRVRATYLADPARVVIDSVPAVTPSRTRFGQVKLGPVLGDGVFLREALDPAGGGVGVPISVIGYARPFEASDVASLIEAGTGAAVPATWSGCTPIPANPTDRCGYGTSDYIDAWGEFRFTIESLAPGTYELFVADSGALEDVAPRGVIDTFTVVGDGLCHTGLMLPAVRAALGTAPGDIELSLAECAPPYARVFAVPTAPGLESEQVFMKHAGLAWTVLTFGTGIDCATETDWRPPELETACEALGLR